MVSDGVEGKEDHPSISLVLLDTSAALRLGLGFGRRLDEAGRDVIPTNIVQCLGSAPATLSPGGTGTGGRNRFTRAMANFETSPV